MSDGNTITLQLATKIAEQRIHRKTIEKAMAKRRERIKIAKQKYIDSIKQARVPIFAQYLKEVKEAELSYDESYDKARERYNVKCKNIN
jgi:hypothetical protein